MILGVGVVERVAEASEHLAHLRFLHDTMSGAIRDRIGERPG
jgi:hypothetical protein